MRKPVAAGFPHVLCGGVEALAASQSSSSDSADDVDGDGAAVGVGVSSSDLIAASNGLTLSNSSIPYSRALRPALQLVLTLYPYPAVS